MQGPWAVPPALPHTKMCAPASNLSLQVAYWTAPLRKTVWGTVVGVIVCDDLRRFSFVPPDADGVKDTVKVQLPPAPKVFGLMGQLFVWTKSPAYVPVI
jgi:hypothetical protein